MLIHDFTQAPPPGQKTVLLFWAPWHPDSVPGTGTADQLLQVLAENSDTIQFGRVQAELIPDLASLYNVTSVPAFVLVNEKAEKVDHITGVPNVAAITQAVQRLMNSSSNDVSSSNSNSDNGTDADKNDADILNARLEKLVNSHPVMLFIKGTPSAPKCGFSRQACELLQSQNISFGTFDILQDEDVRQGLKTYSDWPTFPQIYVRGELQGGLDILKDMAEQLLAEQWGLDTTNSTTKSLDDRLKELVNSHNVMLFMKGLPSAPRCGFSRQIVELLEKHNVMFDAFDILQDEQVRQGLKTYSDWPTYPQLYVKGELIGGLDICKDMDSDGSFKEVLEG